MDNPKPDNGTDHMLTDPVVFGRVMMHVAQRSQPLVQAFFEKQKTMGADATDKRPVDPLNLAPAYIQFFSKLWSNPQKMGELQTQFWNNWLDLWKESARKFIGEPGKTLYEPDQGDRRFRSEAWRESAIFDFIKQSYLLTGQWLNGVVRQTDGMDDDARRKVDFYTRQFIDALSPANFLLTNPDALKETIESNGENLVRGLEHLLGDLERGQGLLRISTTDYKAFEVGRNLAVTPGTVVWQNAVMQLIQYEPSTPTVHKTPLLVVPPWINKYYILDLKPDNSMIRWMVAQGHTVFIVSWVNPDKTMANLTFDDYMREGILTAMDKIRDVTGATDCNVVGYCLGGTLVAMTLAWLAAKGREGAIKSATLLTTLIDFENAGELKLFMDEPQLESIEQDMAEKGYLDADSFRRTFSLLRANDTIWSFVVNNYLMGREPFPFDLLYWNDDATNMPAAMHRFYLRKLYRDNLLCRPGALRVNGEALDIGKVKTPVHLISTREDHIAPWQATYAATQLFKGPVTFTLAASGHVAGVVNPPAKNKYCYWTTRDNPASPAAWLDSATQKSGSWWTRWAEWIGPYAGPRVAPPTIGGGILEPLEDAPGRYVRVQADKGGA